MTVAHLVQTIGVGGRVEIRIGGEAHESIVEALDVEADVAVLRVAMPLGIAPLPVAEMERAFGRWLGWAPAVGGAGVWLNGHVLSVGAVDRFGHPRMTLTGGDVVARLLEPHHGLGGAPVIVDGHVVGHISGHVPHPDSLDSSFSCLIYGTTLPRIRELLEWTAPASHQPSAGPGPLSLSPGERFHAFALFRESNREFAERLMTRLEGSGLTILPAQHEDPAAPLQPDERRAWEDSRNGLVVFGRSWLGLGADRLERAADALAGAVPDPARIIVLNVDGSPLPDAFKRFCEVSFAGDPPDHGLVLRSLQLAYPPAGQKASFEVSQVLESVRDDVVRELNDARGVPKRLHFIAKRWRESGVPGPNVPVLAAAWLIEAGRADLALDALNGVPRTIRALQAEAVAGHALGRVEEVLETVGALAAQAVSDAATGRLPGEIRIRLWEESGRQRNTWLRQAWDAYADTFERTGDAYSCALAAALALCHDGLSRAREFAADAFHRLEVRLAEPSAWESAAAGMMRLVLGDYAGARELLARAAGVDDELARITRIRDTVRLILDRLPDALNGSAAASLEQALRLPAVAAFSAASENGWEAWRPPASAAQEEEGLRRIGAALNAHDIGCGVTGLLTAADLLFAEQVIARHGVVEVVLPFDRDAFLDIWIEPRLRQRVERLLAGPRASVVVHRQTVPDADGMDDAIAAVSLEVERRARERAHRWGRSPLRLVVGAEAVVANDDDWQQARIEDWRPARPAAAVTSQGETTPPAERGDDPRTRDLRRKGKPPTHEPTTYRKRFLVAVGVDRYEEWNPLSNAVNDAKGVAQVLEERFDFEKRLILDGDATAAGIREAITKVLTPQVEKEDLVVFYFAGHGHTERNADGEDHGFLVPVEARRESTDGLLPMEEVVSWTKAMACDDVLYIFDSCFSGFAGLAGGETERGGVFEARLAITAGTTEQPVLDAGAPEGFSDHSVFTGWLLRGLTRDLPGEKPDPINALSLYLYLQHAVDEATNGRETPSCGFLHGHGIGNIWLQLMKGDPPVSG